ncbi:restriction endonuclease subunit S [Methylicorpusculum oleiharenae]|uniref:restriction endonuclease subunit S n=1 Tax=Methylicorpusculum oleiharenae TaxID=1338687 RepID=UPI00135C806C|nr:restriction endonuclease subunit S [Methylicorpusculum oleiharenae]MCD2452794.1 restriction endonuclease subunit S [Methylicorpusculum oleiharenae]
MSEPTKKALVPMLRFPEFRDAGEWADAPLIALAKFRRGSFPQPYGLPEWYDEENGMPFVQVFDVGNNLRLKLKTKNKISKLGAEQSVFIAKGTLIITLQGSIGRVAITQYDAYIDRTLLIFEKFIKPTEKLFFAYVIQSLFEIEKEKAPGGIIKTITKESLSNFIVTLPSLSEQQKIADCLSSIDELVTAQTQKVEALKAHKKGLMQQLFPAEGETVPQLRFPEFRDSWKFKVLGQFLEGYSERVPSSTELTIYSSTREGLKTQKDYYDGRELVNEGEYGVVPNGYFVYRHMSDDAVFKFNINSLENRIAVSKEYPVFKTKGLNAFFLLQKLNNGLDFQEFAIIQKKGGTRTRLYFKTLCSWQTLLPTIQEQQKIANCLSSIDDLISTQTQKLAALKAHKKGLMQQLFPAVDEVQP